MGDLEGVVLLVAEWYRGPDMVDGEWRNDWQ